MSHFAPHIRVINGDSIPLTIGMATAATGVSTVKAAQANSQLLARVIGLVVEPTLGATQTGHVITEGIFSASTGQWDAVTGQSGGLTPDALYYLDPSSPGKLTTTAPSLVGQFVVLVGQAMTSTDFYIHIQPSIML